MVNCTIRKVLSIFFLRLRNKKVRYLKPNFLNSRTWTYVYHYEIIENGHRNNECCKVGRVDGDHNECTQSQEQGIQRNPECQGQSIVHDVDVSGETIGDPSDWSCVEERHWCAENFPQHFVVKPSCRCYHSQRKNDGIQEDQHSCKKSDLAGYI